MLLPSWAGVDAIANGTLPLWTIDTLKLSIGLGWHMYQPGAGTTAMSFDVSLDNIKMITREEAALSANNCDVTKLPAAPALI
jgi:hypothetical protein